jgi:hypothetical protein
VETESDLLLELEKRKKTTADWLMECGEGLRKQAVHWRYLMSQIQLGKRSQVLQPMDYKTLGRMSWCIVTFLWGEYDYMV